MTICLLLTACLQLHSVTKLDEILEKQNTHPKANLFHPGISNMLATETNTETGSSFRTHHQQTQQHPGQQHLILDNSFIYPSTNPCTLTAVVMDPRLPVLKVDNPMWFSLESLIVHGPPEMCIVLQTSSCFVSREKISQYNSSISEVVYSEIIQRTTTFPILHHFLTKSGRVRVAILDHKKYYLKSCSNFYPPSNAWMNVAYWRDEFIDADNDMIMMIQNDAVLCHDIDIDTWREFAFVGAPWRDDYNEIGMCNLLEMKWNAWTATSNSESNNFQPLHNMCKNGYGPQGNGGFSLRSRRWMIKAIESCPSILYSGLSKDIINVSSCKVTEDDIPEDWYFATVLTGIGAPMPLAFEAALFAGEMIFPDMEANDWHGPKSVEIQKELIEKRLGKAGLERYRLYLKTKEPIHFIPIGIHKFWHHHEMDFVLDPHFHQQCPYLKFIIPKNIIPMQFTSTAKELGIGIPSYEHVQPISNTYSPESR